MGKVSADQVESVEATCDEGGLLIGGGCSLESTTTTGAIFETNMLGADATSNGLVCTWNNPTAEDMVGITVASCIYPTAPGAAPEAVPIAERIVHKTEVVDLPEDDLPRDEISCDFGDTLIWGSCGLENPDELVRDVGLVRSAYAVDDNRPNAWACGWDVPPGVTTAKGVLTAICLKPLPATAAQL